MKSPQFILKIFPSYEFKGLLNGELVEINVPNSDPVITRGNKLVFNILERKFSQDSDFISPSMKENIISAVNNGDIEALKSLLDIQSTNDNNISKILSDAAIKDIQKEEDENL